MSKERARRREEREREAAIRTAARAAEAERRERTAARTRAIRAATTDRLGLLRPGPRPGQQNGVLAQKRRRQNTWLVVALLVLHIIIWFVATSIGVQVFALVVTILAFPVLKTLLFDRR